MRRATLISSLFLILGLLVTTGCPKPGDRPAAQGGGNKQRPIAMVGSEPVTATELDRQVQVQIDSAKRQASIFARPSPETKALWQEELLHALLLNAVYRQPGTAFSKARAIDLTKELALEKARAARADLQQGMPTSEALLKHVPQEDMRQPSQVNMEILSSSQGSPAYMEQALNTPAGGVSQIIEDPRGTGGYYVLRIVKQEEREGGVKAVQADQFFIPFDMEAARQQVKEEDLARADVKIVDPTLGAIAHLRNALASEALATRLGELNLAKDDIASALKSAPKAANLHFLEGWIFSELARDPTSGITYVDAQGSFQEAVDLQSSSPGDSDYGYYLCRVGDMLLAQGLNTEARDQFRLALTNARDNYDLSLDLRDRFTTLNDTESLATVNTEIGRMERAMTYGIGSRSQSPNRGKSVLAEGVDGDEEIFNVEAESKVVE